MQVIFSHLSDRSRKRDPSSRPRIALRAIALLIVAGCGDFGGTSDPSADVASREDGLDGGASVFAFGTGTVGDPYGIDTCARLQAIDGYLTSHFVLADDIDCAGFDPANDGKGFLPIGRSTPFSGSLDGDGHVIRELTIDRPSSQFIGLFSSTNLATLHDFGLDDVDIVGYAYVGGLVGHGGATIERVFVTGRLVAEGAIGGLAGMFGGVVTNVYVDVEVTATPTWLSGLLIGYANYVTVTYAYATGALLSGVPATPESEVQIYGFDFPPIDSATFAYTDDPGCLPYGPLYATCRTTTELQTLATYLEESTCVPLPDEECPFKAPWDFEATWGFPATTPSYPCLLWEDGCVAPCPGAGCE